MSNFPFKFCRRGLLCLVLVGGPALSQTTPAAQPTAAATPVGQKILVTDMMRVQQLTNVAISPDGSRALYAITSILPDEDKPDEYTYRTQLFLHPLKTGKNATVGSLQLTQARQSSRQAVWSPDGRRIAFVRNDKGKPQIFLLSVEGGEPLQLTHSPYGASDPQWSPDGSRILFASTLSFSELQKDSLLNPSKGRPAWSLEKPGLKDYGALNNGKAVKPNPNGSLEEIRAYLEKDVADKKAKVVNRLNFQGEATVEPELEFDHLFIIEAKEGAPARALTRGFYSYSEGAWLPDGKRIVCSGVADTLKHPDRERESAIWLLNSDGSGKQRILTQAARRYFNPLPSTDGKTLAFMTIPSEGINFPQIGFASLAGGNQQLVAFDRAPLNLKWSPDSRYLYFTCPSNGGFPLHRVSPAGKEPVVERLSDFDSGVSNFDVAKDRIVYVKNEVANPFELYTADLTLKKGTQLTRINAEWLAGKKLSFPEKRYYTNSKGQRVEYWIMKPTFLKEGEKYPLLVNMHGGPTALWGPGETSTWHEHQYFTAQGYGVVYANPRGSGGYGLEFQRANYQDWGTGPTEDVLAAATDAAKASWVDTSRQVLTGGSYAGYLTAWIVGHDNRFKAAFSQRGVYDLTTFMGEANAWMLVPNYFGGYPWQEATQKVLDANSPLTFVHQIHTPLLIKHGENDLRTGVSQSEMLYKSLKVLGREVEYVRMPGATHELSRSGDVRQRIDRMLRMYEFFERYVGKDAAQRTN